MSQLTDYVPKNNSDAVAYAFRAIDDLPGMNSEQRLAWGSIHSALQANIDSLVVPAQAVKDATTFNWSSLIQAALALAEGLLPTTGIWATLLPVLEAILNGLFPAPTPIA